jgi:hypothetical protein
MARSTINPPHYNPAERGPDSPPYESKYLSRGQDFSRMKKQYQHVEGSLYWLHKHGGVAWWAASACLGECEDD